MVLLYLGLSKYSANARKHEGKAQDKAQHNYAPPFLAIVPATSGKLLE